MKKKFLLIFLSMFFTLSIVGCGKETSNNNDAIDTKVENNEEIENTNVSESTTIVEASEDKVVVENDSNEEDFSIGNTIKFEKDIEYNIDLNNDGVDECILYTTEDDGEGSLIGHLSINDISCDKDLGELFNFVDYFYILDVDSTDDYYEVVVGCYGPSDDLESAWFRFENGNVIFIGYTSMIPDNGMYFYNDGEVTTYERVDIIETNFVPVTYKIVDNKFEEVSQDIYEFSLGYMREDSISNIYDLVVRKEMNSKSDKFTIPAGSEIEITSTDRKEWVNVIYNGEEYWLHIVDFEMVDNDNSYTWESFNNLILAD